jgi:hypothetical protein
MVEHGQSQDSKMQQEQEAENRKLASGNDAEQANEIIVDKKLDGPNRPST